MRRRAEHEPAFVLHAYPYKETSLVIEAFSRAFGRDALLARGARRPRSAMRGVLLAFHPLRLGWSASAELGNLVSAEWAGALQPLAGRGLMCGFYHNELLLKLLAREDPHPALFAQYASALRELTADAKPSAQAAVLRRFEVRLLAELGYGLALTHDVDSGAPIAAGERYHYAFDRGPQRVAAEPQVRWPVVRGATLIALATERYPDADVAAEAKRLMRGILDHYLEERRIFSRRVVQDLAALEDDGELP